MTLCTTFLCYINMDMCKLGSQYCSTLYRSFRREGQGRFSEGPQKMWTNNHFFHCFIMFSIGGGVRRFVPIVMAVQRWNVTGAWYWKGLPSRTLNSERHRCAPGHKLCKECTL
jgi:hypothetical protein